METLFIEATAPWALATAKWALQVLMGNTARCCASAADFAHGFPFCTCNISSRSCKSEISLFFIHWRWRMDFFFPLHSQHSVVCPGKGGLMGTHGNGTSPGVEEVSLVAWSGSAPDHQGIWAIWAELKVIEPLDSNTLLPHPWLFFKPKSSTLQDYCWGIQPLHCSLPASALPSPHKLCRKSLELLMLTSLIKLTWNPCWSACLGGNSTDAGLVCILSCVCVCVSCLIQIIPGMVLSLFIEALKMSIWSQDYPCNWCLDMEFWSGLKQITLYTLLSGVSLCQCTEMASSSHLISSSFNYSLN